MNIEKHFINAQTIIIHPEGRIDALSAAELREALEKAARGQVKDIIVDLSAVDFMDSSGLSALVAGLKALKKAEGNKLILSAPNPQIVTALRLTMLDRIFPHYKNLPEAMQALKESGED